MVGSIDPRCEIFRGTHWPVEVARLYGTRVAENHLGPRSSDRINRPDIWMQAIRSNHQKTLVARGPSTYGSRRAPGRRMARTFAIGKSYIAARIHRSTLIRNRDVGDKQRFAYRLSRKR
jgi:hypothetical protein